MDDELPTHDIYKITRKDLERIDPYSNKFNHIYLYSEIDNFSVLNVKKQIHQLNLLSEENPKIPLEDQSMIMYSQPKPIILHLNSPGGFVNAGIALTTIMKESRVPIILVVEGISASAATFITVLTDKAIIMPHSAMLIHQYFGGATGKFDYLKFEMKSGRKLMDQFYEIYSKYTKIPKKKLTDLLSHDLFLTSDKCKKYGMVEVLFDHKPNYNEYFKKNPFLKLDAKNISKRPIFYQNLIYVYKSEGDNPDPFGKSLDIVQKIHSTRLTDGVAMPIVMRFSETVKYFSSVIEAIPVVNAVISSKIPTYGVIDGPITESSLLIYVSCWRRYINKYAYVTLDYVYQQDAGQLKFDDVLKNTAVERTIIKRILRKYTKLPDSIMKNLFKKRFFLNSSDCVKYGICHGILKG